MAGETHHIAEIILAGRAAPSWLDGRLEQMARLIRGFIEGEETAPKRTEMRKRLDAFREAVVRLQEDLSDPLFVTFIGNDWSSLPLKQFEVLDALATLGNRASNLSMKFAGRGGAERAFPVDREDALSAQELCSWTIMQAMRRTRGTAIIAADNREAWAACNALWRYCGGIPLGKADRGDDTGREPSGWRVPIDAIQQIEKSGDKRAQWLVSVARTFEAIAPFTSVE